MKISFITTVFNEEETIEEFLESLFKQSVMPNEIIIVDGGSTDNTVKKIKDLKFKIKDFKGMFSLLIKKGNRSIGRNEAIKHAKGDIIICSDAGCVLNNNWIKNISEPFKNNIDVVAGYYEGVSKNVFQKCLIPYALVMPDKVDPNNFLPATRSIGFTKKIWRKVDGFDENLSHNEDYAFAKKLQKVKAKIVFKKDAVVYWEPRASLLEAFVMMYLYAYGDSEARIFRPKVILLFLRYLLGIILFFLLIITKAFFLYLFLPAIFLLYIIWAILKNYRYVKELPALYFLPLLQITADCAVIKGTLFGLFRSKIRYN